MTDKICKKFVDEQWVDFDFDQLKKGDIFRLLDPEGVPVKHPDNSITYMAETDAKNGELVVRTLRD